MASTDRNKLLKYFLMFFAIGTLVGTLNTSIVLSTQLAEKNRSFRVADTVIGEFTGAYSFALLLPVMLYVFRKYPVSKGKYSIPILIYLGVFIPAGALHITFMYGSRQIIYNLLGLGPYDYGSLPYRIIMEYIKVSTGFATAFLIYNLYRSFKEKEEEKIKRANLEEQLTRTRLDVLKSQLNPHFLFNTLNMISSTMYEDVKAADSMITNLSIMLRTSLQSTNRLTYSLSEELDQLKLYLDIMKARFAYRLQISFSVEEETLNIPVPHFLLQPLVENSIKHGMENLSVTNINICSQLSDGRLTIEVTDNGPGIKEERSKVLQKGVGLSNTIERLEKTFDNDYSFDWINLNGGLKMIINIPAKEKADNGKSQHTDCRR